MINLTEEKVREENFPKTKTFINTIRVCKNKKK